jgi:hypothetical protein
MWTMVDGLAHFEKMQQQKREALIARAEERFRRDLAYDLRRRLAGGALAVVLTPTEAMTIIEHLEK